MAIIAPSAIEDGAAVYATAQSTAADWNGPTIDCTNLELLAFTGDFEASAARDADFRIQTSNDPRAWTDPANAKWQSRTWPDGSTDGDVSVSAKDATIGAGAGGFEFTLTDLPKYARLILDSQTAGAAATVSIWAFGRKRA